MSRPGKEETPIGIGTSEANTRIPRKVRFEGAAAKIMGAMLLIFLICFFGNAWMAYGDIVNSRLHDTLRREGRVVYGQVATRSASGGNVYVRYTFSVNGVLYSGHATTKSDHYAAPGAGGRIPIRYLPADSRVNQPMHWEWFSWWDVYPFLFTLFLMGVAGYILILGLRGRTLARFGLVVEGRVTACVPNRKSFDVYYVFTTEDNVSVEGHRELADAQQVGTPIQIIYLPRNPRRNDRYPVDGFRIAD